MSQLDLNALNELPKSIAYWRWRNQRSTGNMTAEERVAWALENLPGEYGIYKALRYPGGGEPAR